MHGIFNYIDGGHLAAFDRVVLCSKSPRRRELLAFLKPELQTMDVDERAIEDRYMTLYQDRPFVHRVGMTACELAGAKCGLGDSEAEESGALEGSLYVGADTMVVVGQDIYHKPRNLEEAERMFRSYFGRTHHVVTGVCLRTAGGFESFYAVTAVTFIPYYKGLEAAIKSYLGRAQVMDKAGSYGIQDLDPRFVAAIEGDIHTVIGLPVAEIGQRIAPFYLNPKPDDFLSLDDFTRLAAEVAETLPPSFFNDLHGLVQVQPQSKYHPRAQNRDLLIMGEYTHDRLGRRILLYYGSFRALYRDLPHQELKEKVREVLVHEFRHHLESKARLRDLEIEDERFMADYQARAFQEIDLGKDK